VESETLAVFPLHLEILLLALETRKGNTFNCKKHEKVKTDFDWWEWFGGVRENRKPASVNTSRIPKERCIGNHLVWVASEIQTPMKYEREGTKLFLSPALHVLTLAN
jgi:hypothetical protein